MLESGISDFNMWSKAVPGLAWLLPLLAHVAAASTSRGKDSIPESRILHVKTCPLPCDKTGDNLEKWSLFHSLDELAVCPEPLLLAFNIQSPLGPRGFPIGVRACTLGDASTEVNYLAQTGYVSPEAKGDTNFGPDVLSRRAMNDTAVKETSACGQDSPRKSRVAVRVSSLSASSASSDVAVHNPAVVANDGTQKDVVRAIRALSTHFEKDESCEKLIRLAYVRGTLVGAYSGHLIDKSKTSASLIQRLAGEAEKATNAVFRTAMEVCGSDRSSASTFGVVADADGDFSTVQEAMRAWSDGKCFGSLEDAQTKADDTETDIWSYDVSFLVPEDESNSLQKRDTCRSIRIEQNDDCTKLASRCGIGNAAFTSFNKNLCSKILRPGQPVCCSSGSLPDIRPQPQEDGICAVHRVGPDEGCAVIAATNGLEEEDLDELNEYVWGWDGCDMLLLDQVVCVSRGEPPMPASYPDSVCGPTKPGSFRPLTGRGMADLNPCPLNVCCNVWGKCGTTSDFCTISKTKTGNPGTSNPGENGCQSSCGRKIVNDFEGPAQFRKIAYYEGWNYNRPCLNMNVLDIDRSYTHVHFAFAEISADMQVVIPEDSQKQWKNFVSAQNFPRKILAFGGWAFSNEGEGAGRLREAVSSANRHEFSTRVVDFALENDLDGLDFDWEYPGATDIEGSPPGNDGDGEAYLAFLRLVRVKMPRHMSLSIAAPASYWYLRGFPIKEIIFELDYLVYMTYDFHGQWDVGNSWAQEGCSGGNCLRSHVNATTTHDSFVMITKAGVPTHKVVVGVSSYGRSFKMADSTCRGPQCTFLGERNKSPAKPGRCTNEGGYIANYEIDEIIKKGGAIRTWWDEETDSDYLVYSQVEWVAYMTNTTKNRRTDEYRRLNMGGTSDWAVDLQYEGTLDEDDIGDSDYEPDPADEKPLAPCTYTPTTMDQITNLNYRNEILPHCAARYLISVMHATFKEVRSRYTAIMNDGYDKYFGIYADHVYKETGAAMFKFMMENGNKYFNCEISSKFACCRACNLGGTNKCKNCISDCTVTSPYHEGWEWRKKSMACPPDFSSRGYDANRYEMESISWDFKNDEAKTKFFEEVAVVVGVDKEYIEFPEHARHYKQRLAIENCYGSRPPADGQLPGYDQLGETCQSEHWWHYGPRVKASYTVNNVPNPKTNINKTLSEIDIDEVLSEFELAILADEYDEDSGELVDALVLPIFMMSAGLTEMEKVVEMAKEIEESEKISLIMNLLTSILLVVGGFGGVAAGASSVALRTMGVWLVRVAEGGNTAVGLYTAVNDPKTIPLLIFGLVMSKTSLRSASNVKQAANYRQKMTSGEIALINPQAGTLAGIVKTANTRLPSNLCRYA